MSAQRQTITGELRKWHHDVNSKGERCIVGKMYHDTLDIWDEGDDAVIFYSELIESVNFYLAVLRNNVCVKCPKDEEVKHASKKFNGTDPSEKG